MPWAAHWASNEVYGLGKVLYKISARESQCDALKQVLYVEENARNCGGRMFFLWFICEKSVNFSMLFICGYNIRNHIHHKKANNSARTPTSSKNIVKMSNQNLRSVGSETVNDVSITNDAIGCCYFFANGLNCSRCDERKEECNLLRTEKDLIKAKKEKLEEENKQINSRIKILGDEHMRERQTFQKELQSMKEEHETLSRNFEKELQKMLCGVKEQQLQEMKNLQVQNEELKEQINKHKSEVHKIKTGLSREKSQVEKHQEEFLKVKKNLSREKKKVKEVKEELLVENKAKKDALKEVEKLMRELSNQEADKREDITRLREAANVERAKCDTLKEEIQRLRSMPGRKFAVLFIDLFG